MEAHLIKPCEVFTGSGGRRESSFKQDRRDSQVLGARARHDMTHGTHPKTDCFQNLLVEKMIKKCLLFSFLSSSLPSHPPTFQTLIPSYSNLLDFLVLDPKVDSVEFAATLRVSMAKPTVLAALLGEFRDIYARRESQMSQGSGRGLRLQQVLSTKECARQCKAYIEL